MNHEKTVQLVAEFLAKLPISVDSLDSKQFGKQLIVRVATKDSGVLIGNGGENLRALNYLARKLAERKFGEESEEAMSFLIDVNGYQEKHIETIRANAKMLAERAKLFRHDVEMSPMSAYERLLVHELFSEDPDVMTESHGEGKYRRIVIKCRPTQSPTEERVL